MSVTILQGDARAMLATLPDESAHCCVTSPPYWGLRDYGHPDQMGLESTPEAFVAGMVAVFAEVRRVLRGSGVLFLNVGDSYASAWACNRRNVVGNGSLEDGTRENRPNRLVGGLKEKDLIGIPWRLAFALQADGWYLRSDIIWHKPNPMPESVTDRPTKAHEYVFLLTKSARYFYDAGAIAEEQADVSKARLLRGTSDSNKNLNGAPGQTPHSLHQPRPNRRMPPIGGIKHAANGFHGGAHTTYSGNTPEFRETRNARSVWTIPTQGYSGAHFATFPEELAARCIKAGCPAGGVVLDPFGGSGTTAEVALKLGRRAVLIELNPEYVNLIRARMQDECPLLASSPNSTGEGV